MHPQTPVRASPSPPWPERPTAAPLPTASQNEKAQRLDAIGGSTINDVAEGGTVAATCYPCPMLRHSVSRSRSTPTSPRRGARRTHPRGGHLRALISRYSRPQGRNERHRRDHDAAGIAWRSLAPLVGVGNTQGRRPRRPTEGWAEVEAVFAPLGACVYRLFIFGGRPKASSRRCKKEKVICQISSNSVWHFCVPQKSQPSPTPWGLRRPGLPPWTR